MNKDFFEYTVPWNVMPPMNIEKEIKNQVSKISLSDAKEISLVLKCTPESFKMEIHKNINLTKIDNLKNANVHEIESKDPVVVKNEFSKITSKVVSEKKPIRLDFIQNLNDSKNKNNFSKLGIDKSFDSENIVSIKNQNIEKMDNQELPNIIKIHSGDNKDMQNIKNEMSSKKTETINLASNNSESTDVGTAKEIKRKAELMDEKKIEIVNKCENNNDIKNICSNNEEPINIDKTQEISIKGELENANLIHEMKEEEKKDTIEETVKKELEDTLSKKQSHEKSKEICKLDNEEHLSTTTELNEENKPIKCKENTESSKLEQKQISKSLLDEAKILTNSLEPKKENPIIKPCLQEENKNSFLSSKNNDDENEIKDFSNSIIQKEVKNPVQIINKEYEEPSITVVMEASKDNAIKNNNKENQEIDTQPKVSQYTNNDNILTSNAFEIKNLDDITKNEYEKTTKEKIDHIVQNNEENLPKILENKVEINNEKILSKDKNVVTTKESNQEVIKIPNKVSDSNDKNQLSNSLKQVCENVEALVKVQDIQKDEKIPEIPAIKNINIPNESFENTTKEQLDNAVNSSIEEKKVINERVLRPNIYEEVKAPMNVVTMEKDINKVIANSIIHEENLLKDNIISEAKNVENSLKPIIQNENKNSKKTSNMNINNQNTEITNSKIENDDKEKNDYKSPNCKDTKESNSTISDIQNKEVVEETKKSPVKLKQFLNKAKIKSNQINPLLSDSIGSMIEDLDNNSSKKLPTEMLVQSDSNISSASDTLQSIDSTSDFKIKKKSQKKRKYHSSDNGKKSTGFNYPFLIGITSIIIIATIIIHRKT
ncbi:Hypothetical protein SRAE_2000484900 [Strongyloides ratti]|uniref:Uncharacterized protein n=1 Tax=Strongyloides ratti TaxID=34506 RepID=A0A090N079_STRRB|nr:Hypothetical protein SRAE_2000484900 [Strongyloides ratti]CEF70215.1 Hypothetical protein SRAE_2000484900 [Strongyloides ratti]